MSGTLYLCATPIGNLEDITYRAVRMLSEVDLIAAEDTRTSKKLLDHYNINTRVTSYHEHNKIDKANVLLERLLAGDNIALITDAGTPAISDPGEELVKICYDNNIDVIPLPGPAAFVAAAISSAQPCRRIAFEAFLPKDKKYRRHILEELRQESRTIVLYESPHHLCATLTELSETLGPDRKITVIRELTKRYEEKVKTTLIEAIDYYNNNDPRGEYVLVIAGKSYKERQDELKSMWQEYTIEEHVALYINEGKDKKDAMKLAAKDRGVKKSDIYKALIEEK